MTRKRRMKKPKAVRTSIVLPPDLSEFAWGQALADHCGNLSAYLRSLLLEQRRRHLRNHQTEPSR